MPKSKIAVFSSAKAPLKLEEVDVPALQPGEILVKTEYTTLCRSDLHTYCGNRQEKTPTILGHEIVGRITAFGSQSPRQDSRGLSLQPGDRITWAIYAADPQSKMAQAGIPQKAPDLFKYGHERITPASTLHGGLAEHIILRPHTPVARLKENVPLPVAATINCAVSTVAGALRLADTLAGKRVLVSGAGMLGMMACAMSKQGGAEKVVAADIDAGRLQVATRYGADLTWPAKETPSAFLPPHFETTQAFDLVIECSGVPSAMEQSLSCLRTGGVAIWIGAAYPQRDLHINAEQVLRNLWTIKGLHNYNADDFLAAVQFIEDYHHDFPFLDLIKGGFCLEEANEAFAHAVTAKPFRVGIQLAD